MSQMDLFYFLLFSKRREVYDIENCRSTLIGREYEDCISLSLSTEKLLWMLACNFPAMKVYRICTGHLLQTPSTSPERESGFPDATCYS